MSVASFIYLNYFIMFCIIVVIGVVYAWIAEKLLSRDAQNSINNTKNSDRKVIIHIVVLVVSAVFLGTILVTCVFKFTNSKIDKAICDKLTETYSVSDLVSNSYQLTGTFRSDNDVYSFSHEEEGVFKVFNETKRNYTYVKIDKI